MTESPMEIITGELLRHPVDYTPGEHTRLVLVD